MRQLIVPDGVLFSLTDAVPAPAAWSYSFPEADPENHPEAMSAWVPDGDFHTRFTVFAFVREGRIVLIDAGLGPEPNPYFGGLSGRLEQELRMAGLDATAVEHVLFTHFHLDHVGWAAASDGRPYFPNATYHAPRTELSHWRLHGPDAALPHHVRAFERHVAPLIEAHLIVPEDAGRPMIELNGVEIAYEAAPGHTPGHHVVVIAGREIILVAGDSWHSPAQVAVPDWCHRADRDPIQARASRRSLANWAHEHQAIVAAGHFSEEVCFGRIRPDARGHLVFAPVGVGMA